MFQQFFAEMEWTALPLFALGLFMVMFVAVLVRTFALKSKGDFEAQRALPLSEGKEVL